MLQMVKNSFSLPFLANTAPVPWKASCASYPFQLFQSLWHPFSSEINSILLSPTRRHLLQISHSTSKTGDRLAIPKITFDILREALRTKQLIGEITLAQKNKYLFPLHIRYVKCLQTVSFLHILHVTNAQEVLSTCLGCVLLSEYWAYRHFRDLGF